MRRAAVKALLEHLLQAPGWLVLLVAGGLVLVEDALFVGFVVPAETAAILAGVACRLGHASLVAVMVTVVAAAIIGDSIGYEVGRQVGPRLLQSRVMRRHGDRIESARRLMAERGGFAVLLGRGVAFLRALMPALAGTSRMPYRRFLVFNALGGLIWGVAVVLLGYLAGASYERIESSFGPGVAIAVAVIIVGAVIVHRLRSHARERARPRQDSNL